MNKKNTLILYGSYGYTGGLIAKECKSSGLNVILAGRNKEALQKQSDETGYPYRVVAVDDGSALVTFTGR
jgi:short subunit dehydrogenase-like uncharacterized protein